MATAGHAYGIKADWHSKFDEYITCCGRQVHTIIVKYNNIPNFVPSPRVSCDKCFHSYGILATLTSIPTDFLRDSHDPHPHAGLYNKQKNMLLKPNKKQQLLQSIRNAR